MKKNQAPGWMYLLLLCAFAACPPFAALFMIIVMLCN